MSIHIAAAEDLARNSRVLLDMDELPYLVDSITSDLPAGLVVKFSSGDLKVYTPREPVVTIVDTEEASR